MALRLTESAKKVMQLAEIEARRLGQNFVGTEQIVLGILIEETSIAAKVLKTMRVTIKAAREDVEEIIGRGYWQDIEKILYTPRVKKTMELAEIEANQLGHSYIDTDHIFLGLIKQGEGIGTKVLENMGVDLDKCYSTVIKFLS